MAEALAAPRCFGVRGHIRALKAATRRRTPKTRHICPRFYLDKRVKCVETTCSPSRGKAILYRLSLYIACVERVNRFTRGCVALVKTLCIIATQPNRKLALIGRIGGKSRNAFVLPAA